MSGAALNQPWLQSYDPGVPYTVNAPDMPLHHLLDQAAARHPKNLALWFYNTQLTYRDLQSQVDAFAAALQDVGVRAGDRVMLLLPNVPQCVLSFYAVLKIGATAVLGNPIASSDQIEFQLQDCGAGTILTTRAFLDPVLKARASRAELRLIMTHMRDYLPRLKSAVVSLFATRRVSFSAVPTDTLWMADMLRRHRGEKPRPCDIDPHQVAVLQYTGGTTGMARAVMLSHYNLVTNTMQVRSLYAQATEGKEIFLCALPFSHAYGMTAGMNVGIHLAACLVLLPIFRPGEALRMIETCKPTIFPGVPAMYNALINHPKVKQHDLSSLYACLSGAAPLPIEVKEAFERLTKGRLVEGYGLSEASPVTHATPFSGHGKPGSIGLPVPSTQARVVDPASGDEVAPGEIGELAVAGPQVMKGYWGAPEETAQVLRDGWLYTGDLATMDADGFFQIICRRQEVIDLAGQKIYPRDVEEVLYEHPKIREAAVVGVLQDGETRLRAHVVLRSGDIATEQDILSFCKRRLSPHKIPAAVLFQKSLPRSPVGKLLRRLL